ncbi:MAG: Uma2 family endonuclease [Candidatus Contendobacter sp.]|nr:Uma2 family endonuclease [Candidatus Contendobacter sp.]
MNPLSYYDPNDPYPESDGQPMAENTEQYDWLVKIKENLEIIFADREDVFIAGDLLWYPVPDRQTSGPIAPDVMVAFGRPKGRRGSYLQWEEAGIAPQVAFEVLSPANSRIEMANKLRFYEQYGVEEYYLYDPKCNHLDIWLRQRERLRQVSHLNGWISPRLGIRFVLTPDTLEIYDPAGRPFLNSVELARLARSAEARAEQETARADQETARADQETARADQEARRAVQERLRAERLAERLRALGLDPNDLEN